MEATTITMQDFANMIIVYGFAGLKAIIAHRKEKKKKVEAVIE